MQIDETRCQEIHRFVLAKPAKSLAERRRAAPVRKAVESLVESIEVLRDKGYTWNEVAVILREFGVISTAGTIRQYYTKAIKQRRSEQSNTSLQERLQRQRNQINKGGHS